MEQNKVALVEHLVLHEQNKQVKVITKERRKIRKEKKKLVEAEEAAKKAEEYKKLLAEQAEAAAEKTRREEAGESESEEESEYSGSGSSGSGSSSEEEEQEEAEGSGDESEEEPEPEEWEIVKFDRRTYNMRLKLDHTVPFDPFSGVERFLAVELKRTEAQLGPMYASEAEAMPDEDDGGYCGGVLDAEDFWDAIGNLPLRLKDDDMSSLRSMLNQKKGSRWIAWDTFVLECPELLRRIYADQPPSPFDWCKLSLPLEGDLSSVSIANGTKVVDKKGATKDDQVAKPAGPVPAGALEQHFWYNKRSGESDRLGAAVRRAARAAIRGAAVVVPLAEAAVEASMGVEKARLARLQARVRAIMSAKDAVAFIKKLNIKVASRVAALTCAFVVEHALPSFEKIWDAAVGVVEANAVTLRAERGVTLSGGETAEDVVWADAMGRYVPIEITVGHTKEQQESDSRLVYIRHEEEEEDRKTEGKPRRPKQKGAHADDVDYDYYLYARKDARGKDEWVVSTSVMEPKFMIDSVEHALKKEKSHQQEVLAKRALATAFTKKDTEVLKQLNDVAFSGASFLRCPDGHKVATPELLDRDWESRALPDLHWDIHKSTTIGLTSVALAAAAEAAAAAVPEPVEGEEAPAAEGEEAPAEGEAEAPAAAEGEAPAE
jgi:hypothetical protein